MKPSEYLDALRAELKLPSDYALQKELGVTKAAISKYRNNKAHFDDAVCRRVGALLNKHPGIIMLDMQRQRAREPEDQAMWNTILEKFSMGFKGLMSQATPRRRRLATR
ncbi:transcriptional regulator [Noviherbaspirillum sp. Root189]|uniref:transcriptional regulator n=1 Tax=Noviherbaspirillum sp. Root189 TaxID=1736487 RepID=UPI0007091FDA|nr:transcriptional regulator [Noviherbaspirillum sp. Root189]KRB70484.1 hypothetical protein ASE07_07680 [Noviherbaspirillum sp. Root189]